MKNLKKISSVVFATFCLLVFGFNSAAQSVGISGTGLAPDPSAILDLNSTNKGFLITQADTSNISSPAFGLMTLASIDSCLYMHNGGTSGKTWISIGGVGNDCPCSVYSPPSSPPPTFPCNGTVIPVVDVTSTTGKVWMDRNLGASQVAMTSIDSDAYGDSFQWGRCADGHEKRTSATISALSSTDTPGHNKFITSSSDWRNPKNDNLWQGINGINNPCPTGYRIPSELEFNNERLVWLSNDAAGAFGSPLKLTVGGARQNATGAYNYVGVTGYYRTSTVDGVLARLIYFHSTAAAMNSWNRGIGYSVRCIKG